MNKVSFFFDTADIEYVRKAWSQLQEHFSPEDVAGITTNPNAMAKVGAQVSLAAHLEQTEKLANLLAEIRKDGVLYVQIPNSNMPLNDALKFAKLHKDVVGNKCKLGLKISPNSTYLENIDEFNKLGVLPNVTGLSDAATALLCLSYEVRYISIIPGRMEEKNIDATSHLLFLDSRKRNPRREVIAGSMRTLDGLERSIVAGTVPTIGSRVFDLMLGNEATMKNFRGMWDKPRLANTGMHNLVTPLVTDDGKQLSKDFFEQMDKLGESVLTDFNRKYG